MPRAFRIGRRILLTSSRASVEGSCIESKSRSEHGSMHGFPLRDLARANRAPKKYRRTFWEEERQAQRARRQTQRAVCHGALPATRMRVDLTLLLSLTITRTVSPHQALRARSLRGKPCTEPCSEQLSVLYKIPPLASLGRYDKDDFCFQRSFDARGLCPRLLRMT